LTTLKKTESFRKDFDRFATGEELSISLSLFLSQSKKTKTMRHSAIIRYKDFSFDVENFNKQTCVYPEISVPVEANKRFFAFYRKRAFLVVKLRDTALFAKTSRLVLAAPKKSNRSTFCQNRIFFSIAPRTLQLNDFPHFVFHMKRL
jgi:hypothetical protein